MDSLVPAWYRAGGAVQICAAALLYMLCSGGRGYGASPALLIYPYMLPGRHFELFVLYMYPSGPETGRFTGY